MTTTLNAPAAWTWKNEPELMTRLRNVQNTAAYASQDIMTIVGFFSSREELVKHVERAEDYAEAKEQRAAR